MDSFPLTNDLQDLEALKERAKVNLPVSLSFYLNDQCFDVTVREVDEGAVVYANATLGEIPYSIEAPAARLALKELVEARPSTATAKLVSHDHGRIAVIGTIPLGGPPSIPRVFAAVTALGASMWPLIELARAYLPEKRGRSRNRDAASRFTAAKSLGLNPPAAANG